MYLVINKCVTAVKVSDFSGHYLPNRSTLDIGVLGYIGIVQHKEHSPEVLSIPPGTPCILWCTMLTPFCGLIVGAAALVWYSGSMFRVKVNQFGQLPSRDFSLLLPCKHSTASDSNFRAPLYLPFVGPMVPTGPLGPHSRFLLVTHVPHDPIPSV